MAIYADSERSRQRLGFAKSMLNKLIMMGLNTKTLLYEGFLYRVSIIAPGLNKIAVTAPKGAVVVCSQTTGMKLATADYWLAGFSNARDVLVVDNVVPGGAELNGVSFGAELPSAVFVPRSTTSSLSGGASYADRAPIPGLYPFVGESFWLAVGGSPAATARHVLEARLNFYARAGEDAKRICMFSEGEIAGARYFVTQAVAAYSFRAVAHNLSRYGISVDTDELICARYYYGGQDGMAVNYLPCWLMFYGLPAGLKPLLIDTGTNETSSIGSFAFALGPDELPTVLNCTYANSPLYHAPYFASYPEHNPWRLFWSMHQIGSGSVVNYPADYAVLNTLVPGVVVADVVDYDLAGFVLEQLFGWPNANPSVPPDSAMFYSQGGNVYSWTRKYGAVRFALSGMSAVSLTMPSVVTENDAVRPEIYHLGSGAYVCIAYKPVHLTEEPIEDDRIGVKGVFYGSPFDEWIELPMPSERLLQVKVESFSGGTMILLGVVLSEGQYKFASATVDVSGVPVGEWEILADLPFYYEDGTNWAMALFGDTTPNPFLAGPPTLPQMPAIPYNLYAAAIP